ncbi:MAG TPA: CopD family protein [Thermoanaerobaculia bacterium]|jgi:putative copper export protein|nr:CopD family protein [Thermoanaerobaculia bacterium]
MDFKISEALTNLTSFLASFLAIGAIGFRYVVLRADAAEEIAIARRAAHRAAVLGFIGALVTLVMYLTLDLPQAAARGHKSIAGAIIGSGATLIESLCIALVVIGFALALANARLGWALAAAGVIIGPLTNLFYGQWSRAVNPIHRLAGGLWIGTLFVVLMAGFTTVLHSDLPPIRRGSISANMVHRFSPLALTAFAILGSTGLITAWKHLKRIDALWTTAYGGTLIAKLCVVLIVVALGAWNWRRQRPLLGTESAAAVLRRSATAEVIAATIVLIITSVLVSLPSPR